MARIQSFFLQSIAAFTLLFCVPVQASTDKPNLEIITEDWAPYNYLEGQVVKGFSTEVVQAVMDELGDHYPINIYPGPRGDRMLDTQSNIMYFSLFRTPEREDKYKWVGPISEQAVYFYKHKDNPKTYQTIDDVKQASLVSVPYKGLVTDKVEALGITNVIKPVYRDRQFAMLLEGRAELAVNASPLGVAHYLKQMGKPADALVKTQVKLLEFPLYIVASKEIPDTTIERWQRALERVQGSKQYTQIYNKYLFMDAP